MPLETDEALNHWINKGLNRHARKQARENHIPGYTYYYLVETPVKANPDQQTVQDEILKELAGRFPEIAFIRLAAPDPLFQELQPYSLLIDILYANSGPR